MRTTVHAALSTVAHHAPRPGDAGSDIPAVGVMRGRRQVSGSLIDGIAPTRERLRFRAESGADKDDGVFARGHAGIIDRASSADA